MRRGLRQGDIARLVGTSDSTISRVELGRVGRIQFARLRAIGEAVGAEVELQVRWQGEALDRLLDEAHSRLVARAVELLHGAGWEVRLEVSFAIDGEHGSIDVFARHPGTSIILVVEAKSVVPDNQAMLAALDRKVRLAHRIAAERGWSCRAVGRILVIAEGRTARRRIQRHRILFDTAFPVRTRQALAWIRQPQEPAPSALLLLGRGSEARSSNSRGVGERQRRAPDAPYR
jgi:transcriptional regulator with XRE-family HTH domain